MFVLRSGSVLIALGHYHSINERFGCLKVDSSLATRESAESMAFDSSPPTYRFFVRISQKLRGGGGNCSYSIEEFRISVMLSGNLHRCVVFLNLFLSNYDVDGNNTWIPPKTLQGGSVSTSCIGN